MKKIIFTILILCFAYPAMADRFFNFATYRIGSDALTEAQVVTLRKYDVVILNKNHYDDVSQVASTNPVSTKYHADAKTWNLLKDGNDDIEIYTYTTIFQSNSNQDATPYRDLNTMDHYGSDRTGAHSIGDLSNDNPSYILRDTPEGNEIYAGTYTYRPWLNFGDASTQTWIEEAVDDILLGQPWEADGLYTDHGWCLETGMTVPGTDIDDDYDTLSEWRTMMTSALTNMQAYLAGNGTLAVNLTANAGPTQQSDCLLGWQGHDGAANFPKGLLSELTFITGQPTSNAYIQIFPPANWLYQLQAMNMSNVRVYMQSDTDAAIDEGGSTLDGEGGNTVTFWQALWYAMGSFALGKHGNAYFIWGRELTSDSYSDLNWKAVFDEMDPGDNLHLGSAVGSYTSATLGGQTIYYREFQNGCVIVNPQVNDATEFTIPAVCGDSKILDATNYSDVLSTINTVSSMTLDSHEGVFLYKDSATDITSAGGVNFSSGVNF